MISTRAARAILQDSSRRHLATSTSSSTREKLVILGSGWGGYQVLKGVASNHNYDVTLISPSTYFNFTPLLASCAVGTLEYRTAIEPVRRYTPQATVHEAWCDKIDFTRKVLKCTPATPVILASDAKSQSTAEDLQLKQTPAINTSPAKHFEVPYDKLVIAVGAYSQTFNTPGVKEHALFLKDVKDARAIRTRLLGCFELASSPTIDDATRKRLMTFCIVGGGPTGVEFAANLHDLVATDISKHYPTLAPLINIRLYDVAKDILSMFDESMREYASRTLRQENVEILTGHHVERVEPGVMHVKEQGAVPFGLLVWSTGLAPNPLLQSINENSFVKHDRTGSLITDDHLRLLQRMGEDVMASEDVWAIGDAAIIQDAMLPATAQVASQKAKYIARKLNKPHFVKPFSYNYLGAMVNLGEVRAVFDRSDAKSGPRLKSGGWMAWLLWHSAYATMALSWRNKLLIPAYWLMTRFSGRDMSRF